MKRITVLVILIILIGNASSDVYFRYDGGIDSTNTQSYYNVIAALSMYDYSIWDVNQTYTEHYSNITHNIVLDNLFQLDETFQIEWANIILRSYGGTTDLLMKDKNNNIYYAFYYKTTYAGEDPLTSTGIVNVNKIDIEGIQHNAFKPGAIYSIGSPYLSNHTSDYISYAAFITETNAVLKTKMIYNNNDSLITEVDTFRLSDSGREGKCFSVIREKESELSAVAYGQSNIYFHPTFWVLGSQGIARRLSVEDTSIVNEEVFDIETSDTLISYGDGYAGATNGNIYRFDSTENRFVSEESPVSTPIRMINKYGAVTDSGVFLTHFNDNWKKHKFEETDDDLKNFHIVKPTKDSMVDRYLREFVLEIDENNLIVEVLSVNDSCYIDTVSNPSSVNHPKSGGSEEMSFNEIASVSQSKGSIRIEMDKEAVPGFSKVTLFNTAGRVIASEDIKGSAVLDISDKSISSGFVFLRLSGKGGEFIRKLILQ